ncbi:MAG: PAS domain S-box protein [Alphaproteobacteria bacterium]
MATAGARFTADLPSDEAALRQAFDLLPCAVWLTDPQGNSTYYNKAYTDHIGLRSNQILEDGWENFIYPEDRERLFKTFSEAIERQSSFTLEHRVQKPDGQLIWYFVQAVPRRDSKGRFIGFIGTSIDITTQKVAERELIKSENRFRAILENAPTSVFVRDLNGIYILVNQKVQEKAHDPSQSLIGRRETNPDFLRSDRLVFESGEALEVEEQLNFDGVEHTFLSVKFPLHDADGKPYAVAAIATDISEIKAHEREAVEARMAAEKATSQAKQATEARTRFLVNMSHELRTPLNAIIGFSEVIENAVFGEVPARYRDYAKDISSSGKHLLHVINEILDLARAESGKLVLHESEFDIESLCHTVLSMTRLAAAESDVRIEIVHAEDVTRLRGDKHKLIQALVNLISNAVRFSPAGGSVKLSCGLSRAGEAVLTVRDEGIGMTPEGIETALEEYGQVHVPDDTAQGGTGLGLPLSKRLVELHGGHLEIESEPDRGTTARIVLPASRVRRR